MALPFAPPGYHAAVVQQHHAPDALERFANGHGFHAPAAAPQQSGAGSISERSFSGITVAQPPGGRSSVFDHYYQRPSGGNTVSYSGINSVQPPGGSSSLNLGHYDPDFNPKPRSRFSRNQQQQSAAQGPAPAQAPQVYGAASLGVYGGTAYEQPVPQSYGMQQQPAYGGNHQQPSAPAGFESQQQQIQGMVSQREGASAPSSFGGMSDWRMPEVPTRGAPRAGRRAMEQQPHPSIGYGAPQPPQQAQYSPPGLQSNNRPEWLQAAPPPTTTWPGPNSSGHEAALQSAVAVARESRAAAGYYGGQAQGKPRLNHSSGIVIHQPPGGKSQIAFG